MDPKCILAYVDEGGSYDHVAAAAADIAARHGARLIYYDADSASRLSEPVASDWSAEGEGDQYGNPLTAGDLETLGRAPIAAQVRAAQAAGVDAYGWLPGRKGMDALAQYAGEQHADLIVLPDDVDPPDDSPAPVAVVSPGGEVTMPR